MRGIIGGTASCGRRWIGALALGVSALLGGCASAPPWSGPVGVLDDAAFAPPTEPVDATQALAISPAMKRYLRETIAVRPTADDRRKALIDALYRKGALKLDYDASRTRNAAQAFDARAGNCLSLVMMTGAFAKELGLAVRYQEVRTDEVFERWGDLVFAIGHVNLALTDPRRSVGLGREKENELIVDFQAPRSLLTLQYRMIDEATLTAMYLNNRAAEALGDGHVDNAYWWAREAVRTAPSYLPAYNTLAVIYRQHRQPAAAEHVLTQLLAHRPDNPRVLSNLVLAVRAQGRGAEADALAQRLARLEPDPPYADFRRAMTALGTGDLVTAHNLLLREVDRSPHNHEFQFWLGSTYARLGDARRAATHLNAAIEASPSRGTRELYSTKLARLKSVQAH